MMMEYLDVDKVADLLMAAYKFTLDDDFELVWRGTRIGASTGCFSLRQCLPTDSNLPNAPDWFAALEIIIKLKLMANSGGDSDYTNLKLGGFYQYLDKFATYNDDLQYRLRDAYLVYNDYREFVNKGYPCYSWDEFSYMWKYSGHTIHSSGFAPPSSDMHF